MENLIQKSLKDKTLNKFANEFETADSLVNKVITGLTFEEIRRICEERQDILEFLQNHQLAEPIKPFIS